MSVLRRLRFLVLLLPLLGGSQAHAVSFLFDFGDNGVQTASPTNGLYWNNITATIGQNSSGQLLDLVGSDNSPSPVDFVITSRFNAANVNGTTGSTLFPSNATSDSLFGNTASFNGISNIFPAFKLTSLTPGFTYNLTFYASRVGAGGDNREAAYTVTGLNGGTVNLNASENINNVVTLNGISPTAAGEIAVSMAPTLANNNASKFTYLGVLKVDVVPEPGTALLLLGGLAALGSRRRRATC